MLTNPLFSFRKNGAEGQNRTADTGIFSPLLYRLSYLATDLSENNTVLSAGSQYFFAVCSPEISCLHDWQGEVKVL